MRAQDYIIETHFKAGNITKVNDVDVVINDFKATEISSGLDEAQLHEALDTYTNKDDWKGVPAGDDDVFRVTDREHLLGLFNYTTQAAHDDLDTYVNKDDWKSQDLEMSPTEIAKLDQIIDDLANLPEPDEMTVAELHSALDSYANKMDWSTTDEMVASELHAALDTYVNKGDWKGEGPVDIQPVLDAIDALNDITANEVRGAFDANDFKDKNTEFDVHTWLDSYVNKSDWKATSVTVDQSATHDKLDAIALETAVIADIETIVNSIDAKTWFGSADRAHLLGLANYTTIDADLDAYTNKDDWKSTPVAVNLTPLTDKVDALQATADNIEDDTSSLSSYDDTGINTKLDDLSTDVNANGFISTDRDRLFSLANYTSIHADLDSYTNKDDWKGSPPSGTVNANIVSVNGTSVTTVDEFKADATDLTTTIAKIDAARAVLDNIKATVDAGENYDDADVQAKLDAIIATDHFTQTDRDALNAVDNFTGIDVHNALDSYANKDDFKSDVSSLNVDVVSIGGNTVTSTEDFKDGVCDLAPVLDKIDTLNDFDPANDVVGRVTLVDTTAVNTDMRGTDGALTTVAAPFDVSELHVGLDSYTNKALWKESASTSASYIASLVWSADNRELTSIGNISCDLTEVNTKLDDLATAVEEVPTAEENATALCSVVIE